MEYDDLRIALERRKRLMDTRQQKSQMEMTEWNIEEKFSIMAPEQAMEVDSDILKKKYPGSYGNAIVKRMLGNEADFRLQFQSSPSCTHEAAVQMRDSIKSIIMRLQPANTFYSMGTEQSENNISSWFDFDSFGLDGKIYNFLFFTPLISHREMVAGGFHCKEKLAVIWKPVFIQMMKSLKELEIRNEK